MQFVNSEILIADLPAVEKSELNPISRDYLKIQRIEWLITTVILTLIAAALIYFTPEFRTVPALPIILAVYLFLVVIYRFTVEKGFPWKGYAIREHDIIYQRGWIIRKTKSVPFSRIQNCSIHAGPLERKYGLSGLSVFTAGSTGADLRISGLTTEIAESIRSLVLTRIDHEGR